MVALTIVPECDNNCFAHSTNDWVSTAKVNAHSRATTSQYWLDHLAVLIIESDLLGALDVITLIDEFAHENENKQLKF